MCFLFKGYRVAYKGSWSGCGFVSGCLSFFFDFDKRGVGFDLKKIKSALTKIKRPKIIKLERNLSLKK